MYIVGLQLIVCRVLQAVELPFQRRCWCPSGSTCVLGVAWRISLCPRLIQLVDQGVRHPRQALSDIG